MLFNVFYPTSRDVQYSSIDTIHLESWEFPATSDNKCLFPLDHFQRAQINCFHRLKKKTKKNIEVGRIIKAEVKKTKPLSLNHIHFYCKNETSRLGTATASGQRQHLALV